MRKTVSVGALACAAVVAAIPAGVVDGQGRSTVALTAKMTGAAERPGPGDANGRGTAVIRLNANRGRVCFNISMRRINGSFAAHIHEAPAGAPGPVVVPLFTTPSNRRLRRGCVRNIDRSEIREILANPRDYYVNVHNPDFENGAIRGQLRRRR